MAAQAGMLRARHFHRKSRAVSLADSIGAAAACSTKARWASADPQPLALGRDENILVLALPDSTGHTGSP
jgi:hypothetical protein